MARNYGERYLTANDFVGYCKEINVKTDNRELEYYEKAGIMLPVARVVYPEDYVILRTLWPLGAADEPPRPELWPELYRLFDKRRVVPEQYADLTDDELIDSFDRELGKNPYLIRPTPEAYKPWNSYTISIPYRDGQQLTGSTADHYYSYWQVHQIYYIQKYPDLYKNKILLDRISDEVKQSIFRPWPPEQEALREFEGKARLFDALSFWITMYDREQKRTFALVPEEHQVKHLDASQLQAYRDRLTTEAGLVQERYSANTDSLYKFLYQLIELYDDYQVDERFKLSEELRNDVVYQAQLIGALTGAEWEKISEELGRRYTSRTKKHFRHLDILTKERDEAHEILTHFAEKYKDVLGELKIPSSTYAHSPSEINELLDYCEREGLSVLLTALSGMVATEDDYAEKFRRVARYTNLKNVLTALEFLLKDFITKHHLPVANSGLNAAIESVMKNETGWVSLFTSKKNFTRADDSAEFFTQLNHLVHDADLVRSEDTYWARAFLIASLARNLTVHEYPDGDWFYGELFGEMLRAAIYVVLYSWQVAKRESWV